MCEANTTETPTLALAPIQISPINHWLTVALVPLSRAQCVNQFIKSGEALMPPQKTRGIRHSLQDGKKKHRQKQFRGAQNLAKKNKINRTKHSKKESPYPIRRG